MLEELASLLPCEMRWFGGGSEARVGGNEGVHLGSFELLLLLLELLLLLAGRLVVGVELGLNCWMRGGEGQRQASAETTRTSRKARLTQYQSLTKEELVKFQAHRRPHLLEAPLPLLPLPMRRVVAAEPVRRARGKSSEDDIEVGVVGRIGEADRVTEVVDPVLAMAAGEEVEEGVPLARRDVHGQGQTCLVETVRRAITPLLQLLLQRDLNEHPDSMAILVGRPRVLDEPALGEELLQTSVGHDGLARLHHEVSSVLDRLDAAAED